MTRKLLFAVVLVLSAAAVAIAQVPPPGNGPGVQPGGPPMGQPPGPPRGPQFMGPTCPTQILMVPPMIGNRPPQGMNLTTDQQSKLNDILAKSEDKLNGLRKTASEASRALFTLVLAPDSDAAKIKSAHEAAVKADAEISKAQVDEWMQIRSILTTDQMKQLAAFMGPRRGMGMPGGMPHFMPLPTQGQPGGPAGPPPGAPGGPPPNGPAGPPPGGPGAPSPGVEPPPPAPGQ